MKFLEICEEKKYDFSAVILEFLVENPDFFGSKNKKNKPDLNTSSGRADITEKMAAAFSDFKKPSLPNTMPDEAVAIILDKFYKISEVDRAICEHRKAMAAENFVGYLLELYIFSVAYEYSWCLCPNAVVRSVDFVKLKSDGAWRLLQVKNRDNSENSSSVRVRDGTKIEKWFRTYSRKPETNWNNFPDQELAGQLNETGFRKFIYEYLDSDIVSSK